MNKESQRVLETLKYRRYMLIRFLLAFLLFSSVYEVVVLHYLKEKLMYLLLIKAFLFLICGIEQVFAPKIEKFSKLNILFYSLIITTTINFFEIFVVINSYKSIFPFFANSEYALIYVLVKIAIKAILFIKILLIRKNKDRGYRSIDKFLKLKG